MTGTLELLCGPSGVGKTSSLPKGFVRSYRWTTRDPREDKRDSKKDFDSEIDKSELLGVDKVLYTLEDALEIRNRTGVFESKYGGSFVTIERFFKRKERGELISSKFCYSTNSAIRWTNFCAILNCSSALFFSYSVLDEYLAV